MKLFWESLRTSKHKGPGTDETILKERWREHFRGQYIIGEQEVRTKSPRTVEKKEEELQEITTEEVRETIKRLKRKRQQARIQSQMKHGYFDRTDD